MSMFSSSQAKRWISLPQINVVIFVCERNATTTYNVACCQAFEQKQILRILQSSLQIVDVWELQKLTRSQWSHKHSLQPADPKPQNPGRHLSHLRPPTPGLHKHRPESRSQGKGPLFAASPCGCTVPTRSQAHSVVQDICLFVCGMVQYSNILQ